MTTQEKEMEAAMLIMALDDERDNLVALRRLMVHGALTVEEHSTILARLQERIKITSEQLAAF